MSKIGNKRPIFIMFSQWVWQVMLYLWRHFDFEWNLVPVLKSLVNFKLAGNKTMLAPNRVRVVCCLLLAGLPEPSIHKPYDFAPFLFPENRVDMARLECPECGCFNRA